MARPQPSRPNAGERLAAAGALLAVAGAVVIVLAGVARNVLAVLVIAASLLLFVGSGWYAISRRGVRRLAAGLVMACLLALFAVTLALADTSIVRGIIAAALSVLSVIAARYALRRTPKALGSAADRYPAAPPCQHPVLIMNLKSGGGKAQRFRLAEECRARGIEPVILSPVTTCSSLPRAPSPGEPMSSAWRAATDRRPWSPASLPAMTFRSSASRPGPAITSRLTWDSTAMTWSGR